MDGDFAPLAEYAELCRKHEGMLIIDEAHAVGIYGQRGSGSIEDRGLSHQAIVVAPQGVRKNDSDPEYVD